LLSNCTCYSTTYPDACISTKSGKSRNLNYIGQLSIDTAHHVITGALANFADQRNSQYLSNILEQTTENLESNGLQVEKLLANTGYSSGEALKYLKENNRDAYIPNFGQYKSKREGFVYNEVLDQCECQCGNIAILPLKETRQKYCDYDPNAIAAVKVFVKAALC